jgi:Zn finger protein HypA/HybF involved in hydrogenase expression
VAFLRGAVAGVEPDHAELLRCVECGRPQPSSVARGWKAYLTADEEEPAEALVYCPECAEREFDVNLLEEVD